MAYTWTTPVTDRMDGTATMTYVDMNRITQNVAHLQEEIYGAATISKTSWTRNDIIDVGLWTEILSSLRQMAYDRGIAARTMTNEMFFNNINAVEGMCADLKNTHITLEPLVTEGLLDITNEARVAITVPVLS